ncbi:unnamed protein product [Prunus armeniaca]|uniref:Major facilitator superfamily (MFS) profile domain-containing protein n=1 Tax=Prunus armeniaca TaxID=36596 RepID=A0A6J5TH99_PRUAR|nr:unnamed protein product [Prunus armeniaca]
MPDFLKEFFPVVYQKTQQPGLDSNYCKYDNQGLQLYIFSLPRCFNLNLRCILHNQNARPKANHVHCWDFLYSGNSFQCCSSEPSHAYYWQDLAGMFESRFGSVSVASCATVPFGDCTNKNPWGTNVLFQLNVTIGILFANLTNYGTSKIAGGWGWRLSLDLAGVPAAMLTLGSLVVVDTPNSLISRGKLEEGKAALKKIRGVDNVEPEFLEIVDASRVAKEVKHPFRNLLRRKNRPQLDIAILMQVFQKFTGINAIMFYAPVLFQTLGFESDASLYSAVITGAVNVLSTLVSIYFVDRAGRRALLLEAGIQMFLSQLVVAIVMGLKVKDNSNNFNQGLAVLVVVKARSAGHSVAVCVNMLFTFVIALAFLSMLCHMKFGIFLFFTSWVFVMRLFVLFLILETKDVPIEEMTERVWKHWFWKRFMDDGEDKAKGHA